MMLCKNASVILLRGGTLPQPESDDFGIDLTDRYSPAIG